MALELKMELLWRVGMSISLSLQVSGKHKPFRQGGKCFSHGQEPGLINQVSPSFGEGSSGRKWISKQKGMEWCELVESVQNLMCFQQKASLSTIHTRHRCLECELGQSCWIKQTRGINKSRAVKHSILESTNISHRWFSSGRNLSISPFKSPWNLQVRNNSFPGFLYYNPF